MHPPPSSTIHSYHCLSLSSCLPAPCPSCALVSTAMSAGGPLAVHSSHLTSHIPTEINNHYDVVTALDFELVKTLQETIAPQVPASRAAYDGSKSLLATNRFAFGDSGEFDAPFPSCILP
ncbi:hypothetical protein DENSPDRAFT_831268 [Dentipellis sp. KUC8613]|nr:hypothetical protein DENSPDRAFT_831268 [Dentipellis sp. KUC8613]